MFSTDQNKLKSLELVVGWPEAANTRLESTRALKQRQHQSNFATPIFVSRGMVEAGRDPPDVEPMVHDLFSNTANKKHSRSRKEIRYIRSNPNLK